MSEQNNNTQIKSEETVSAPSTFTALKDQFLGATKEVFGAVFNENLQNAGAEQRIQGERNFENLQQSSPSNTETSWFPFSSSSSSTSDSSSSSSVNPSSWTEPSSEPSKLMAIKDQLVGSTKEVFGAVFNQDLQNSGAEQRIHGEREYEKAIMSQENQGKWDQGVGTLKESAGRALDDKKMQAEGVAQRKLGEAERIVNA